MMNIHIRSVNHFALPALIDVVFEFIEFQYNEGVLAYLRSTVNTVLPDSSMVLKRKIEFLAGRFCVRRCFKKAGVLCRLPLPGLVAGDGPIWPKGIKGSISHCTGLAGAVISHSSCVAGLGMDIEPIQSLEVSEELKSFVMTEREQSSLPEGFMGEQWFTLTFSAKEALFKLLHPLTKTFFDFQDATVAVLSKPEGSDDFGCIKLTLEKSLGCIGEVEESRFYYASGTMFTGFYSFSHGKVFTLLPLYRSGYRGKE